MKIKSFTGKSYKETLDLIKKEFGPNAVIMESEEIKGEESLIKITAAIDFEEKKKSNNNIFSNYLENELLNVKEMQLFDDSLKKEIKEIKEMLIELKMQEKSSKNIHYSFLRKLGIKDEFVDLLLDGTEENNIYEKISSEIKAGYRLSNGKTIMLVGPTGAGKTTTIVKLASFTVKIGKKVGIINLDSFRLGAFEQMRVFCQLLGIPFVSINSVDEFNDVYKDFSKDKNIVFVDTTGRNPKDSTYIKDLCKIKESGIPVEIHLTASLSMQDDIFIKAKENYKALGIDYIIFTKLDEAYNYGSIYNIFKTYNKPISYLTNGQRIPNDIQAVSNTKLTNIILGRGLVQ